MCVLSTRLHMCSVVLYAMLPNCSLKSVFVILSILVLVMSFSRAVFNTYNSFRFERKLGFGTVERFP